MRIITEKAYAKLNLSLDVLSKMDDGYHAMRMIMQSISLYDDVSVRLSTDGSILVRSNLRYLPQDERNIASKASRLFFNKIGSSAGAIIDLKKRIPVCAGLGGGSSNGAAVLRALNVLTKSRLSLNELMAMAAELGSDVPFCLQGGTMLAEGRGTILTPLTSLPHCYIVVCKPSFSISTPKLFQNLNCSKLRHHPDTQGMISALKERSLSGVSRRMYNVFEEVLPEQFSDIAKIKVTLLDYGALGVSMSGTGSAVFGIFDCLNKATTSMSAFSDDYSCFLTEPVGAFVF